MNHPEDLLPDYAMGLLEDEEQKRVEAHLQVCPRCRAEVRALREAYYSLPLALKPPAPRRRRRPLLLFAAALAALLLVLAVPAYRQARAGAELLALLARPEARVETLRAEDGRFLGRVVLTGDGEALLVLAAPPPPGKVYQAWGHTAKGPVSLGITAGRVLRVRTAGFQAVGVSLEPPGGSPRPTHPLGRVPL